MSEETERLQNDVQQTTNDAAASFNQLKENASRVVQSAADAGRAGIDQLKGKLSDSQDALKGKLSDGREALTSKINDGKAALTAKYSDGRAAVQSAAEQARVKGQDLKTNLSHQIEQNPLQAIAIAAGVGVVVGLLLRR